VAIEKATFGGGCFWCLEAVYLRLRGVESVVSGYTGGALADPTYEQICSGRTGHAEVVQIAFDPQIVGYRTLLEVLFATHDATTLNRQGNDVGTQYRSIILYHDDDQRTQAEGIIAELAGSWPDPIVTTVEPLGRFYDAEAYHQDFYRNNPGNSYCHFSIPPKLEKLGARFAELCK
jgi:peptide-methionine (S)-S-oxide reductase